MMFDVADTLYVALAIYTLGTLIALTTLVTRDRRIKKSRMVPFA